MTPNLCCRQPDPGWASEADLTPEEWVTRQLKAPAGLAALVLATRARQSEARAAAEEARHQRLVELRAELERAIAQSLADCSWLGEFRVADGVPFTLGTVAWSVTFDLRPVGYQPVTLMLAREDDLGWAAPWRPWSVAGPSGSLTYESLGDALVAAAILPTTPF